VKFQTNYAIKGIVLSSAYEAFPTSSDLAQPRKYCPTKYLGYIYGVWSNKFIRAKQNYFAGVLNKHYYTDTTKASWQLFPVVQMMRAHTYSVNF